MNVSKLAEELGLEEEEYLELVQLFVETGISDMDRIQTAIDKGNAEGVAMASHSLKGAAGNLGFTDLFELAKKINDEAREGRLDGTSDSLQLLKEKFNAVAGLIQTEA